MPKWEYARILRRWYDANNPVTKLHMYGGDGGREVDHTASPDSVHTAIDGLGQEGWELIAIEQHDGTAIYWLKRPATES